MAVRMSRPHEEGARMTPTHHLAELNIGRLLAPTDDPRVAEFMATLDRLDHLQVQGDSGHAFG